TAALRSWDYSCAGNDSRPVRKDPPCHPPLTSPRRSRAMAKIAAAPNPAEPDKPKAGKKSWIVIGVIALLAVGGGVAVPLLLAGGGSGAHAESADPEPKGKGDAKQAVVPFDSVVVNVADGRYTRYLRVKILLVTEAKDEKAVQAALEKEKAFLQT